MEGEGLEVLLEEADLGHSQDPPSVARNLRQALAEVLPTVQQKVVASSEVEVAGQSPGLVERKAEALQVEQPFEI